jgi:PPM family protein phosphatase
MTALLRVSALTNIGSVRAENQDCVLVGGWVSAGDASFSDQIELGSAGTYVVAVCDGLGGHAGGSVASRIAALTLGSAAWPAIDADLVRRHIKRAAINVQTASDDVRGMRGLGTTVAGLAFGAAEFCVFNVGDSSIFRATDGYVGELSVPDRRDDPHRPGATTLSQSLSIFTAVPVPHTEVFPIPRPLRLLVCSDGLTDVVDPGELRAALQGDIGAPGAAEKSTSALLAAALAGGAPDNISLVVVDVIPSNVPVGPAATSGPVPRQAQDTA